MQPISPPGPPTIMAAILALGVGVIIVHSSPLRAQEPVEAQEPQIERTAGRPLVATKESKQAERALQFSAEQQRRTRASHGRGPYKVEFCVRALPLRQRAGGCR